VWGSPSGGPIRLKPDPTYYPTDPTPDTTYTLGELPLQELPLGARGRERAGALEKSSGVFEMPKLQMHLAKRPASAAYLRAMDWGPCPRLLMGTTNGMAAIGQGILDT
jgi:hypothetical protein